MNSGDHIIMWHSLCHIRPTLMTLILTMIICHLAFRFSHKDNFDDFNINNDYMSLSGIPFFT